MERKETRPREWGEGDTRKSGRETAVDARRKEAVDAVERHQGG